MDGLQITAKGKITKITKMELCESIDTSKVKITKTLMTPEDIFTFIGDDAATYPVIPGSMAIGCIIESADKENLPKDTRVYLSAVTNCGVCLPCINGMTEHCTDLELAGKNVDGYLRDFVVAKNEDLYVLPDSVSNDEAIFIDYIAISLSIIDKLALKKAEHVAIIGGSLLGAVFASLLKYYQCVPIVIDTNTANLEKTDAAGIYYSIFSDNKLESQISDITGARMVNKLVYIADSDINTDLVVKLAAKYAKAVFVGSAFQGLKVNFKPAIAKQLDFMCITNGLGYIEQAINLLANKAVDLSAYKPQTVPYKDCDELIKKVARSYTVNQTPISPFIVNMLSVK